MNIDELPRNVYVVLNPYKILTMKLVLHAIAIFAAINLPAAAQRFTTPPVPKGRFEELTLEFSDAVSSPTNCSEYFDIVEVSTQANCLKNIP